MTARIILLGVIVLPQDGLFVATGTQSWVQQAALRLGVGRGLKKNNILGWKITLMSYVNCTLIIISYSQTIMYDILYGSIYSSGT